MAPATTGERISRGSFRVEIHCPLQVSGPLHVGSGQRLSTMSDAPILRLSDGTAYIPGSTPRGVIRDWCEREAPRLGVSRAALTRLFGPGLSERAQRASTALRSLARGDGSNPDDRQGRLIVRDLKLPDKWEVRDHVRIKPEWGATEKGAKFDQEIILCDELTLIMIYEGDSAADEELLLLNEAIGALREGLLSLGGKSGWGQGRVRLTGEPQCWVNDRSVAGRLAEWLQSRLHDNSSGHPAGQQISITQLSNGKPDAAAYCNYPRLEPWSWLQLDLRLKFEGPMLTAGVDREVTEEGKRTPDDVFLRRIDGRVALPGSSIRGPLLAHASRIAASLPNPKMVEIANRLRGAVGDERPQAQYNGRKGLVRFGEALAIEPITCIWNDHVAIDRVTGFAVTQKLFNTRALQSPTFETQIQAFWYAEDDADTAAVALLLFVLRDASQELLWMGSRTTRGYGFLKSLEIIRGKVSRVYEDSKTGLMIRKTEEAANLIDIANLAQVMDGWKRVCTPAVNAAPAGASS